MAGTTRLNLQDDIKRLMRARLRVGSPWKKRPTRHQGLAPMIDHIVWHDFAGRVLPFANTAAEATAAIPASRRTIGSSILHVDLQFAAIAHVHGATVATRNTPDFADCGIDLINTWNA